MEQNICKGIGCSMLFATFLFCSAGLVFGTDLLFLAGGCFIATILSFFLSLGDKKFYEELEKSRKEMEPAWNAAVERRVQSHIRKAKGLSQRSSERNDKTTPEPSNEGELALDADLDEEIF